MASLQDRKSELIRTLESARGRASTHAAGARRHADLGKKLRTSFTTHRWAWLGGAALLGLVLVRPSKRNKAPSSAPAPDPLARSAKTGLWIGALKLAFDLSKPLLTNWATGQLAEFARKNAARGFRFPREEAPQRSGSEGLPPF
jgi:hypothetical protein